MKKLIQLRILYQNYYTLAIRVNRYLAEFYSLYIPYIVTSFDLVVLLCACCVCDLLAGQLHHSCSCQFTKKSHDIISFSLISMSAAAVPYDVTHTFAAHVHHSILHKLSKSAHRTASFDSVRKIFLLTKHMNDGLVNLILAKLLDISVCHLIERTFHD